MPRSKQAFTTPAADIRRQRDQVLAEMRTPEFSSVLDRLHALGKLNASQLSTGKRWLALVGDHSRALGAPRPPVTVQFDRDHHGGRPADPASEAGQASRHRRIVNIYDEAVAVLCPDLMRILDDIVIHDRVPTSLFDLGNLKVALNHLNDHWSERRKARFE